MVVLPEEEYKRLLKRLDAPTPEEPVEPEVQNYEDDLVQVPKEITEVLSHLSDRYIPLARKCLCSVASGQRIKYDHTKGSIYKDECLIVGSNLSDILIHLFKFSPTPSSRPLPVGLREFLKELSKTNFPASLILNQSDRAILDAMRKKHD